MLKALEISGFKSFADKTRFLFPAGITSVVGPNGSGKSNVVDAIKWVLGEQSVKSLRGKEMADVIFNGSGSRRPMNAAEVTLTFDNAHHLLAVDTPEVHITRRVYRSGEGEYLINRQPARLRDIRDLLSGTGLGSQAYSVIEQGKVDVLLQASPRDRRVIFEEAAGISRFKARKLEALRRLDRVEQNLLRLSDIVDEVDGRLRGVRMQAGKARRYKEYTERLQELRTQVGLVDWRRLSDRLAEHESVLDDLRQQRDAATAEAEAAEAGRMEVDHRISELTEEIRGVEARIADTRERIALAESTIEHERRRQGDLEQETARYRRQMAGLTTRADDLRQQLAATEAEVRAADEHHRDVTRRVAESERSLTDATRRLDHLREETEHRREQYVDQMRQSARLGNEASALSSQVDSAAAAREHVRRRLNEVEAQIEEVEKQAADVGEALRTASERHESAEAAVASAEQRRDHAALQLQRARDQLTELRQRRTALGERIGVLEELQQRQEGVGAGVKEVLAAARRGDGGPWEGVHGMLADLLRVSVEVAPLVEVALGPATEHVVVQRREPIVAYLREHASQLSGRVGFLTLAAERDAPSAPGQATAESSRAEPPRSSVDGTAQPRAGEPVGGSDLEGTAGVLGRADRFVETDPKFRPLAERLLGSTWIVEDLATATRLAVRAPGAHFVTLAGEALRADGVLLAGPRHQSTGLISRRSQLRALREQLQGLEAETAGVEQQVADAEVEHERATMHLKQRRESCSQSADDLARQQFRCEQIDDRRGQFRDQRQRLVGELEEVERRHESSTVQLAELRQRTAELESSLQSAETELVQLDEQVARLGSARSQREREATQVKVELAKSEERLRNFQARLRQFEESRNERRRTLRETEQQLVRATQRAGASERGILQAESEIAELYLRKESLAADAVGLINERESLRTRQSELSEAGNAARTTIRRLEETLHERDLAASELRHQRNTLADRLREDYGIELAELEHEPNEQEQHERESVQQEIDELRRKINNLGNVNVEALEELEQLESRHESLFTQHDDLVKAKNSLQRIIEKINVDSRRLFAETLETVRGHFRALFRDLFGGGQADIVLDDETDILESGIEIVARPPGKEPRSISLLSGGEKTLTCVALLLAIFRSRPSPFCVLDEVDAALDEANIDRFIQVLRDFLAWTQFIIVTHSKKTMTCATTLYGVTMQESGVSKQVSVSFEDVSEDGHISPEAIERDRQQEIDASDEEQEDEDQQAA